VDIVMGIGYGDEIDKAMAAFKATYDADSRVMQDRSRPCMPPAWVPARST
tara:strand:- start:1073 stop:1222 length:150 start_codon:yes stop_codon:yes gene_type:complete